MMRKGAEAAGKKGYEINPSKHMQIAVMTVSSFKLV